MKYIFLSLIFISLIYILPEISFAQQYDLSHFKNRFELKVNETGEKIIVDKSLLEDLSIETYVRSLATYLTAADAEPIDVLPACKGYEYEKPDPELMKSFSKAFDWMKKSNLGAMLVDPKFLKFLNDVDLETKKVINDPQFVVVANLDNSTYFYKKAFIKYLSNKLQDLAKSYFNSTVFLKPVTYVADDYANFIVHKKMYHQNILSYYLETMKPEDLGLTEIEKKRALSSILDSRLSFGFGGYWESRKIKNNFDEHGFNKLQESDKGAEKRWSKHANIFDERIYKVNSIFSGALFGADPIIINLGSKKEKTDDKPSLAFDEKCPEFLYESRRRFEFARVALGMASIPYSGQLFSLVKSKYQPQALSEGMYYGYLESTNQYDKKEAVLKQSMNPLLK